MSSSAVASARLAVVAITGSSDASTRWPSVCPSGTSDVALYVQKTDDDQAAAATDTLAAGAQTVAVVMETPKMAGDPLEQLVEEVVELGARERGQRGRRVDRGLGGGQQGQPAGFQQRPRLQG